MDDVEPGEEFLEKSEVGSVLTGSRERTMVPSPLLPKTPSRPPCPTLAAVSRSSCAYFVAWPLVLSSAAMFAAEWMPQASGDANDIKLLMLTSGRIVDGEISPRAGGYLIEKPHGRMFVPYEQVRFEAVDLSDAYRKLRKSFPQLTASSHVALAKWCLNHNQISAARRELLDALDMEPQRPDALRMLARIDERNRPQPPAENPARVRSDGFESAPVESLAGMERTMARTFAQRVQPILLNKCGNARCHGSKAENDFRLIPVAGHSTRLHAERNLASVLKYVDRTSAQKIWLYTAAVDNHAAESRSLFHGRAGARQLKTLESWLRGIEGQSERVTVSSETSGHALGNGVVDRPSGTTDGFTVSRGRTSSDLANDPFDPAVFNQQIRRVKPAGRQVFGPLPSGGLSVSSAPTGVQQ